MRQTSWAECTMVWVEEYETSSSSAPSALPNYRCCESVCSMYQCSYPDPDRWRYISEREGGRERGREFSLSGEFSLGYVINI